MSQSNDYVKNFESTVHALLKSTCVFPPEDIRPYLANSILYESPPEKAICRVANILLCKPDEASHTHRIFSAAELFEVVNFIDMTTDRTNLYKSQLRQECALLIQQGISANAPWEDILSPLKQYKANLYSGCLTNPWLLPALIIFVISMIQKRLGDAPWRYDLSQMIEGLTHCNDYQVNLSFFWCVKKLISSEHPGIVPESQKSRS